MPSSLLPSKLTRALLVSLLAMVVHGQNAPVPVSGAAYARYGDQFYIVGGYHSSNDTVDFTKGYAQLFSMDLSVPWDAAAPVWKRLSGGPKQFNFPAVISSNGQTLVTMWSGSPTFAWRYDIKRDLWTPSKVIAGAGDHPGVDGVVDSTTGTAYFMGVTDASGLARGLVAYDFEQDSISTTIVGEGFLNIRYYKSVLSPFTKTILYFGGHKYDTAPLDPTLIVQYSPSTKIWSALPVQNPTSRPSARADHCMAISDDGTKVVVFGGRSGATRTMFNDLYVLDLKTMMWQRGPDATASRTYTTCTIYGSTFIVWGGQDVVSTASGAAILFDIEEFKYVQRYTPPPAPSKSTPGSVPTSTEAEKSSGSGAAIGGGVAGACVVLALAAFLVIRRRRRRATRSLEDSVKLTPTHGGGSSARKQEMDGHDGAASHSQGSFSKEYHDEYDGARYDDGYAQRTAAAYASPYSHQQQQQYPQKASHPSPPSPTRLYSNGPQSTGELEAKTQVEDERSLYSHKVPYKERTARGPQFVPSRS